MSLKNSILKQLAKGPRTLAQLRDKTGAEKKRISKALHELIEEHKIRAEKGVYSLEKGAETGVPAKIVKLGRSFGFAAALDASGDIFIPGHSLKGAMPGDEVVVQLFRHPRVAGSREGEVVEITVPNNRAVGTVQQVNGRTVLIPDACPDTPLSIRTASGVTFEVGDKVAGEIVIRGARHQDHRVIVLLRFGSADSAKMNAKAMLYAHGIEKNFPDEVRDEAKQAAEAKVPAQELAKRRDLRHLPIFTIDSASTKDIDDAISIKKTDYGYKLGVHIADVSYYVRPGTTLDAQALHRATSIYYADSVIPMLPKALSNGACSLNPQEDRLAFSCSMKLDQEGRVLDYKFIKSIIRSRVKGVYTEINRLLGGEEDTTLLQKYSEVAECLPLMQQLYTKLAVQRAARGSLELDTDEAKLVIDEKGRCVGVEKKQRGVSERMIEEFMLLANSCAANLARRRNIPFVYRVHEKPAQDRADALVNLLAAVGISFHPKAGIPTQQEYAKLLDETRGTPLARPVHTGVLRSMAKAKYEPVPNGHFGLALDDYAHFTSPIRRYADLAIHRILSDMVAGVDDGALRKKYSDYAAYASAESTEKEIVAQSIERDCDDCYKAEYMRAFIGQVFEGVISSVTSFGIYVQLQNTVEGMVHVSQLSDRHMDLTEGVALTDPGTGKSFRLGDSIRVRLAGVDISRGNIDFLVV